MILRMPEDGGVVCPHCGNVMTGTEAVPYGKEKLSQKVLLIGLGGLWLALEIRVTL